jgi:membrane-bound lytic murein transglycosylase B
MGLPQFMPSSYRRYAVDFDGDGRIDLLESPVDAIGSIASYLKAHGWSGGEVATVPVTIPAGSAGELVSGLQRVHTAAELKKKGVRFASARLPGDNCSIVELPRPWASSKYVAAFGNFEAITRYNRSTFYTSAMLDLAAAIRAARTRPAAATEETAARPAS